MSIAKINNQTITTLNKINSNNFYPLDSYTKLLLKFNGVDGAQAYTAETGQTVTFAGTAQLDTAQSKFGGSSLLLDGNSDYVTVPDSNDWYFGTGDFTIDCWVRFNSTGTDQVFIGQRTDPIAVWYFLVRGDDGSLDIGAVINNVTTINIASNTLSWETGTWYHLALVRNGNNFYIFRDGIRVHSATSSGSMPNSSNPLAIGVYGNLASNHLDGHMENVRVSKGIARWTSNFTPPVDIAKINGITI